MKRAAKTWTATNERDGSEIYRGTSEAEAARVARKAAEDNARSLQALAPSKVVVSCDGVRRYYYASDPTIDRMRARKVFYY